MNHTLFKSLEWRPFLTSPAAAGGELLVLDMDNTAGSIETLSAIRNDDTITLQLNTRKAASIHQTPEQAMFPDVEPISQRLICSYKTDEVLAVISDNDREQYRLTRISWNGRPTEIDLRLWIRPDALMSANEDILLPSAGITLTGDMAKSLLQALEHLAL